MRSHQASILGMFVVCTIGCGMAAGARKPVNLPALPENVILDLDLTQGNAGPGEVTGGTWDDGWRVTSKNGERIVFDAGHPIASGYLLASFTMKEPPFGAKSEKVDWIGLHQDPSLSQAKHTGDIFYARAGDPKYNFSRVKAGGRKFDDTEWEKSVGAVTDWLTDDKTVQTVKLEWRNGQTFFHDTRGAIWVCGKKQCGEKFPVDKLRYAFIGSDKYSGISLRGIRFVKLKLVEYQPAAK